MTLFVERRRPVFTTELSLRVILAWAMIAALLLVTNLPSILAHRFPDPDDALRLIQVRDFLAGQGWFDLAQHRAGDTPMHWSRLVDLPIAGVILLLRGLIGTPAAELAAMIVVPMLTLLVCLLLIGRIAWRVMGDEIAFFACLTFAFCVPVIEQLRPMRIDHHGWQIAMVLLALNGLMARSARAGGWVVGTALAVQLSISIEGLPLAAAIMAVLAWRWIRVRGDRQWLISAMHALAAGSAALYVLAHGFAPSLPLCDTITPVHLAIFAWGALVVTVCSALEPQPRATLLAGFAVAGGGALFIVSQAASQCMTGAFAGIDPLARTMWLERISEGLPIWHQSLPVMLQIVLPPAIAIVATIRLAGRASGWLRIWWIEYAVILIAAFAISIMVGRAGAVAGALAAIPLGWQLREWLRGVRHLKRPLKRAMVYGGVALALVPAAPALLLVSAAPGQAKLARALPLTVSDEQCAVSSPPLTLAQLPKGRVLAPLDVAPQVLVNTPHVVLATGHHRAAKLPDVIRAFIAAPAESRALLLRERIDYIALCPAVAEPKNYAHDAPGGLAAALLAGKTPAWLAPVPAQQGDGWMVWRVLR